MTDFTYVPVYSGFAYVAGVIDLYSQRLHSSLGHQPPEEYEQTYYGREIGQSPDDAANKTAA